MPQVFDKIEYVTGDADILSGIADKSAFRVFDERAVEFLSALSAALLRARAAKAYPDVITFAFWCRKANLTVMAKPYDGEYRLGRGAVFHIAPSNVAVNFAYSLAAGMLAGNANITRIPSKPFVQTEIISEAINGALLKFPQIAERLCLIRYGHDKEITDALSSLCRSRVIWGGDDTVAEIRKSPLPSEANEVTFPDRFSICVINADKYLTDCDKAKIAKDFFNDTYLTDQNACTSPRIIFWLGTEREKAKTQFWGALADLFTADSDVKPPQQVSGSAVDSAAKPPQQAVGSAAAHSALKPLQQAGRPVAAYDLKPVQAVNKLTTACKFAADNKCRILNTGDNKIVRVAASADNTAMLEHLDNSGYFYECDISNIGEILPICGRKLQTLSYIGFDPAQLRRFVMDNAPSGIDRIAPVGKTMDFFLNWDGVDLIRTLSRIVGS